jgi:DNA-binding XRE family transcriptional regulator
MLGTDKLNASRRELLDEQYAQVQIGTAGATVLKRSRCGVQSIQSWPSFGFSQALSPAQRRRLCVLEMRGGAIDDISRIRRYVKVNLSVPAASTYSQEGTSPVNTLKSLGYTQTEVADLIGSSQSRVAKMEAGDPSVSVDLLIRTLLALGANRRQVGRAIGSSLSQ